MDLEENGFQAEMKKINDAERERYGWHFLAKDVADFCNISFFGVFERTAQEVFAVLLLMKAKIKINEANKK